MKKMAYLLAAMILLAACNSNDNNSQPAASQPPTMESAKKINEAGEQLFKIKCMQCHLPNKDFAAPAMAGVEKRWADKELLYAFIKNSQEVIAKDKYAAALYQKWNQAAMLPFPDLANTEIDAILEYCNQVAEGQ